MRISKYILIIFLLINIVPIFSILFLSQQHTEGNILKWYFEILKDENFVNSFLISVKIATFVGILTTIVGFMIALTWFEHKKRLIAIFFVLALGLLPPDIIALSISKLSQILKIYNANAIFLTFGLILYCLPIVILLFWSSFYYIKNSILVSATDLGLNTVNSVFKIIVPLSSNAILSSFLLSFLLTINEYSRTFYLSGAETFLSEYLNGKLSSGTNESIYAGASITVLVTVVMTVVLFLFITLRSKNANRSSNLAHM